MDVLDFFLDGGDSPEVAVTAQPAADKPLLPAPAAIDELDLLMEEFSTASDTSAKKDALMAMLALTGRKF